MTHPDLKTPQETGDMTPKTGDFGSDKNEATRRLNHSSGSSGPRLSVRALVVDLEESDRWTIGGQRAMTQLVNPNSTYQGG